MSATRQITVRADQLRVGQHVTKVPGAVPFDVRRRRGQWPVVTAAEYAAHGEDGGPMVYLELSDAPGGCFPLHPDELVTVLDGPTAAEVRRS